MPVQAFNPADNVNSTSAGPPVAAGSIAPTATTLVERLVAEVRKSCRDEDASALPKTPLDQAMRMLSQMKSLREGRLKFRDFEAGIAILDAPPEVLVTIVGNAMSTLVNERHADPLVDQINSELLISLLRRKLPYASADISKMLKLLHADSLTGLHLPVVSIVSNVERFAAGNPLPASARHSLKNLSKTFHPNAWSADERKIGERIVPLLAVDTTSDVASTVAADSPSESNDKFNIATGEAWTNALLVELGKLETQSRRHWHKLMDHCQTASASKPAKKWLKRAGELLESVSPAGFVAVVGPTLQAIGNPGRCQKHNCEGRIVHREETEIHNTHVNMLRGLVWATSLVDDDSLIASVGDAAEKCFQKIREVGPRSPKVGNACLLALASLATIPAVAQLGRLKARAKHASTRKQIEKAYVRAAENAGMTREDLIESGVPDFGMTTAGVCRESIGDFTAEIRLQANHKPVLTWIKANGKTQKSVPAAVKAEHPMQLKAIRKKVKEIDKLMPSIRCRVEQLFLAERTWNLADFRQRFLDHPVVAVIARNLIWNLSRQDQIVTATWHNDRFVAADGHTVAAHAQTEISIWHPITASVEEVLGWRNWLETNQVCQPFKQAHREIYILTDAERQTNVYSNRFAAHIVRQHQLSALCQQRGWRYGLQGDWDSWNAPFIDMPQHGIRAGFYVDPMEGFNELSQSFIYTHLSTDKVRFLRLSDEGDCNLDAPLPLDTLPPLVFSEIMRDVDLFVGVTSIGNDPAWQESGEPTYTNYWQQYSFGELSKLALTRRQTLEASLPRLGLADCCKIDGRFLTVQGKIRNYKIHLGSGNVLMSPNDQYLCIVQKRGPDVRRTDKIFLPFEGDNTLSLILSKAFLLIDDDTITDTTITNQIRMD